MAGAVRPVLAALAAGTLFAALAAAASAQQGPSQEQLKQRYDEKVGEAWFKDGGWTDDYDAARAKAKESGKAILAYFSRSYSP